MCAFRTRTVTFAAAGTALLSAMFLSGCATDTAPASEPYAKVAGAAVGAVADPATLADPLLPAGTDFGPGWAGPGPDGGDDTLSSRNCGLRAVEGSKLAAGNYDGPDGVKVQVYVMHAAPASVDNWLASSRHAVDRCLGSGSETVQPLPAVDGHPTSVGMRVGPATTWWAVGDSDGYAAVASVTVPETAAGANTDVWAAAIAFAALRAAAGGPAGQIGAMPAGGGDRVVDAEPLPAGWQNVTDQPATTAVVTGGGAVTLPDGTRLSVPAVPEQVPAPQGSAAPGDTSTSVVIGGTPRPATVPVNPGYTPPAPDPAAGVMAPWDYNADEDVSHAGPVPGPTENLP